MNPHKKIILSPAAKKVDFWLLWLIPFGALLIAFFYWHKIKGAPLNYIALLFLIPTFFGYIVVSLTTGPWKLWSWKTPYSFKGRVLPQIGFLWAGYLVFSLLIISAALFQPMETLKISVILKIGLLTGILYASIGTNFDMICTQVDLLEVHAVRSKDKQQGVVPTVLSYSLVLFGLTGFLYGAFAKVAHYYLVETYQVQMFCGLLLGGIVFYCLPFLVYFYWVYLRRKKYFSAKPGREPCAELSESFLKETASPKKI